MRGTCYAERKGGTDEEGKGNLLEKKRNKNQLYYTAGKGALLVPGNGHSPKMKRALVRRRKG